MGRLMSCWQAVWAAGLLCLTVVTGCDGDGGFTFLEPELVLLPGALGFDPIVAGQEIGTEAFFIENAGQRDLEATLTLSGADAAVFGLDTAEVVVEPGDSAAVLVTFAPDALRGFEGTVEVTSNDPARPEATLPLAGRGREPRLPDIDVPDNCIRFGEVAVGEAKPLFFRLENLGDADLEIGSITQTGSGAFSLDSDPSGQTYRPENGTSVVVTYRPVVEGGDSGEIVIPSNDPDEPSVVVCIEGNGGGDSSAFPTADIDCPGTIEIVGTTNVALDGSGSFDPGANPLTYAWSIVRRPGAADPSVAPLPSNAAVSQLTIEAAGIWEVALQVFAEIDPGVFLPSVPAKCVIDARPTDGVYVELTWNGRTSDFDLHLAEGNADFFVVPGDCSWCNPNPDWGVPGFDGDDPELGPDDGEGLGPEFVAIPIPANGTYVVRVHHFDDGDDGGTTANVQVFLSGQLAWSGSRVLGRNQVWEVGQINWPNNTFGAYSAQPQSAGGTRECR